MDTAYQRVKEACSRLVARARKGEIALYATFVPIVESTKNSPLLTRAFASESLPQLLNAAFKTAIALGALVAVLRIAYAGYTLMMSDIVSQRTSAKDIIKDAVIGLVLLLAVWLILNTINPQILNLDLLQSLTPVAPQQ